MVLATSLGCSSTMMTCFIRYPSLLFLKCDNAPHSSKPMLIVHTRHTIEQGLLHQISTQRQGNLSRVDYRLLMSTSNVRIVVYQPHVLKSIGQRITKST